MILIDTNVLARSRQIGHIHYQAAIDAMIFVRTQRQEVVVISPQVLMEYYAAATRRENGLGMTPDEAIVEIEKIQIDYPLLPESAQVYPQWEMLVRKHKPTNRRIFDTRHVAFMLAHQVSSILSFNDQDFSPYSEIQVLNPFDVLGIPRV